MSIMKSLGGYTIYDEAAHNFLENGGTVAGDIFVTQGEVDCEVLHMGNYWEKVYPIGSVYISYVATSPAELFGGEWVAITGVFPYFNAGTGTGGSNSYTKNFNHTHSVNTSFGSLQSYYTGTGLKYTSGESVLSKAITTASGGVGNVTIHTMPAYQTLYA